LITCLAATEYVPLLEVENLQTHFRTREGIIRAVDGVSLTVEPGETVAIVGETAAASR
jgi:ABC-type dipeptide/oligopeptide/nickel transport system ATPase component